MDAVVVTTMLGTMITLTNVVSTTTTISLPVSCAASAEAANIHHLMKACLQMKALKQSILFLNPLKQHLETSFRQTTTLHKMTCLPLMHPKL